MLAGSCINHVDRAAIGVCVICRKPICVECSTPMAGVNRCADCLGGMEGVEEISQGTSNAHPLVWLFVASGLLLSTAAWAGMAALFR